MSMPRNIPTSLRLVACAFLFVAFLAGTAVAQNGTPDSDAAQNGTAAQAAPAEANATPGDAMQPVPVDQGENGSAEQDALKQAPAQESAAAAADDELDPDDIIFQGKLYSSRKQQVSTAGAGTIDAIHVDVGASVKEEQPLVNVELLETTYKGFLNDVSTEPLIDIETRLAEIDAQILEARRTLQEVEVLAENDFAAPASVSEQRIKLDILLRKRESVQRNHDNMKAAIEDRVENLREVLGEEVDFDQVPRTVDVEAPFDGHVLRLNPDIHVGQTVPDSFSIAMVGVLDPMVIRAHLFELEASRLQPGEQCYFTLGSYPDRKFPAEVKYIALTPISPGLDQPSYYEVELSAPNPDLLLREGFKVEVVVKK
jgi:biotin carboxyl carrier protein